MDKLDKGFIDLKEALFEELTTKWTSTVDSTEENDKLLEELKGVVGKMLEQLENKVRADLTPEGDDEGITAVTSMIENPSDRFSKKDSLYR